MKNNLDNNRVKIKALVLDYGGVISAPQNPENVSRILQILNLDGNDFRDVYFRKRENYDNGRLSGEQYWRSVLEHFNIEANDSQIGDLIHEDVKSWTQLNEAMIQFIAASRTKLQKLAIISNMNRDTLAFMEKHFQWLRLFDELVYSCDVGKNKPDPGIYETCLRQLGLPPHECLFVDDATQNVEGAVRVGMNTIHYQSFMQFSQEVVQNFIFQS